jgi:hypothetical protein
MHIQQNDTTEHSLPSEDNSRSSSQITAYKTVR